MMAKTVELIWTTELRGTDGISRAIERLWMKDGALIAEYDPFGVHTDDNKFSPASFMHRLPQSEGG